ncbi:hypothetical protein JCM10212_001980 [Sporobolomyces blumeae]
MSYFAPPLRLDDYSEIQVDLDLPGPSPPKKRRVSFHHASRRPAPQPSPDRALLESRWSSTLKLRDAWHDILRRHSHASPRSTTTTTTTTPLASSPSLIKHRPAGKTRAIPLDEDDIIDLRTLDIVVDRGVLRNSRKGSFAIGGGPARDAVRVARDTGDGTRRARKANRTDDGATANDETGTPAVEAGGSIELDGAQGADDARERGPIDRDDERDSLASDESSTEPDWEEPESSTSDSDDEFATFDDLPSLPSLSFREARRRLVEREQELESFREMERSLAGPDRGSNRSTGSAGAGPRGGGPGPDEDVWIDEERTRATRWATPRGNRVLKEPTLPPTSRLDLQQRPVLSGGSRDPFATAVRSATVETESSPVQSARMASIAEGTAIDDDDLNLFAPGPSSSRAVALSVASPRVGESTPGSVLRSCSTPPSAVRALASLRLSSAGPTSMSSPIRDDLGSDPTLPSASSKESPSSRRLPAMTPSSSIRRAVEQLDLSGSPSPSPPPTMTGESPELGKSSTPTLSDADRAAALVPASTRQALARPVSTVVSALAKAPRSTSSPLRQSVVIPASPSPTPPPPSSSPHREDERSGRIRAVSPELFAPPPPPPSSPPRARHVSSFSQFDLAPHRTATDTSGSPPSTSAVQDPRALDPHRRPDGVGHPTPTPTPPPPAASPRPSSSLEGPSLSEPEPGRPLLPRPSSSSSSAPTLSAASSRSTASTSRTGTSVPSSNPSRTLATSVPKAANATKPMSATTRLPYRHSFELFAPRVVGPPSSGPALERRRATTRNRECDSANVGSGSRGSRDVIDDDATTDERSGRGRGPGPVRDESESESESESDEERLIDVVRRRSTAAKGKAVARSADRDELAEAETLRGCEREPKRMNKVGKADRSKGTDVERTRRWKQAIEDVCEDEVVERTRKGPWTGLATPPVSKGKPADALDSANGSSVVAPATLQPRESLNSTEVDSVKTTTTKPLRTYASRARSVRPGSVNPTPPVSGSKALDKRLDPASTGRPAPSSSSPLKRLGATTAPRPRPARLSSVASVCEPSGRPRAESTSVLVPPLRPVATPRLPPSSSGRSDEHRRSSNERLDRFIARHSSPLKPTATPTTSASRPSAERGRAVPSEDDDPFLSLSTPPPPQRRAPNAVVTTPLPSSSSRPRSVVEPHSTLRRAINPGRIPLEAGRARSTRQEGGVVESSPAGGRRETIGGKVWLVLSDSESEDGDEDVDASRHRSRGQQEQPKTKGGRSAAIATSGSTSDGGVAVAAGEESDDELMLM